MAAGRRELVAGLPDQRPGRRPPVPQRGRRGSDRRRAGHHHLHHRRAARGHRPRHRARLRRHHRERRDHAQGAPEHARRDATRQTNRKAFLSAFADRLFTALLALPPSRWTDLAGRGDAFQSEHLLLAWFADQGDEAEIAKLGFDGAIRQDPGDFIYPVDSNVSPASKLNAVTDRSLDLDVRLDAYGNADNTLTVGWTNRDRDRRRQAVSGAAGVSRTTRTLGMYFRLYVPERSRLEGVTAGTNLALNAPSDAGDESGRMVIANYFRIPPGSARLQYRWTSPYPADLGEDGVATYRLTIQRQPGLRAGPLTLQISVAGRREHPRCQPRPHGQRRTR